MNSGLPSSRHTSRKGMWMLVALAPLILLAGCPADPSSSPAAAPGKVPAQATAPKLATTVKPAAAPPSVPVAATPPQESSNAFRAQQLIVNAERSYRSGVSNYQANRLDAARVDFDFAVDIILTSGIDLRTEPALSDEMERLLNAINSLELAALKQGNGFSPKLEAAPLDTAEDITFPANPELVARLKTELNISSDLPLIINDQVAGYINVFSNSESFRKHMAASLQRVGKYRGLIQNVLKQEGVPQDIIYLAVAESGFQPQVVNPKSGAGGMWQFMASTGSEYGLVRNGYFDYRFDPEKSSRAYARYIKALYNQFGDWYLAMAAYDWGPGNIVKAVSRTGYADYWELYRRNAMPAETRAYVPQILAAIIMAKNPERYGLNKLVPSPAVIYDTVSIDYAVDLKLVADVTSSTVAELVALNPSLLRLSTPRDTAFDLHIPPGTRNLYMERIKEIPEDKRATWRFHEVKPGETIDSIAAATHGRVADIIETNGISSGAPLEAGDELIIPVAGPTFLAHPQHYVLRRGDTLVTVADRFSISVEDLRRWNRLSSTAVRPGRVLNVAEPVRITATVRRSKRNVVSRGSSGRARTSVTRGTRTARSHASFEGGRTSPKAAKTAAAKQPHAHAAASPSKSKRKSGK